MHAQGLLGILVLLAIASVFSSKRSAVRWRIVFAGVALQFVLAYALLRFPYVAKPFEKIALVFTTIIGFADEGTSFLFGRAADASGPWGFIFAVKVLPVIVFFASLMAVLYHLRIMQRVVAGVAWLLRKALGITGVEALSSAANIFLGQTEAPLLVRPYIAGMTRSQIMAIMTGGFATIAGSVMAAYVGILGGSTEEGRVLYATHLMTASLMSAPAGLVMAKIMLPEEERPRAETVKALLADDVKTSNVVDAAASGATDGLKLALNVAAMLVAFIALLAMINYPLAAISRLEGIAAWRAARGIPEFTLQNLLGYLLTPMAWALGIGSSDARAFGSLMGTAVIATEFVAYLDLGKHVAHGTMSPRACQIATYALCGFANIPSIAIQIGGLSAMAPERRADLVKIGPRAMIAGALACWMTGAVAGVFLA